MRFEPKILAAVSGAHACVGAAIATAVPGPLLAVDDLAYLAMGRTLAGGGAAPMASQPPYGSLYPALLAPGWFVGLDEPQMVTYARCLNAGLGALLIPILYLLVRRLTAASFRWSLLAAVVGASLPAALLTSSIVWTERLLPLLVAGAVLSVLRARDRATDGRIVVAVGAAVAMYAAHPRLGLASAVVLASIAATAWQANRRKAALLASASGATGVLLAGFARSRLATQTFGGSGTYDAFDLAERRGWAEVPEMAIHGLGTLAYLPLATAGFAVLGAVMVLRQPVGRATVVATLLAVVAVAGWFLTGVGRSDAYLHGRYVEVVAPILVALGVIGLRELSRRQSVLVIGLSVVAAGLFGAWAGPGDNWSHARSPVMMLGTEVSGAPFGGRFFEPGAAALVAVVVGLAAVGARCVHRWGPALVFMVAIAAGVASGLAALDSLHETSTVGQVQAALADESIERLEIDLVRVPPALAGAAAWEVGLDRSFSAPDMTATHVLIASDTRPPEGATHVAEFGQASIWRLR